MLSPLLNDEKELFNLLRSTIKKISSFSLRLQMRRVKRKDSRLRKSGANQFQSRAKARAT